MEAISFEEDQKWSGQLRIFHFAISSGLTILFIYLWHRPGILGIYLIGSKANLSETTVGAIILFTVFGLWGIFFQLLLTQFIIRIKDNSVQYKFSPFPSAFWRIPFDHIDHYEIRKYKAWQEFKGYGKKKYRHGEGRAYIMKGNWGLELFLNNGEIILLRTQKPELLKILMKKLLD